MSAIQKQEIRLARKKRRAGTVCNHGEDVAKDERWNEMEEKQQRDAREIF